VKKKKYPLRYITNAFKAISLSYAEQKKGSVSACPLVSLTAINGRQKRHNLADTQDIQAH
jgi:hypothetical protein